MTGNYKRIAKNTMFLYFRMIIIMAVTLYTTRIVLSTLGIVDFGIYSIVASFVIMFSFLNSALTAATQRFLSFELGKVDDIDVQKVFSISILIHIGLAFIILFLSETIGLWFLNNKINIPPDRMEAAFWVFQFVTLNIMIEIIRVPYNALVIAHERMSFFAYMSIFEAIVKLLVVYLLVIVDYDKLVLYSGLILLTSILVFIFYYFYNKKYFKESNFIFIWDKILVKEMFTFTGWSLFGAVSWVFMNQGINILLNIFFGPAINAARELSLQVNIAISSLINSFRTAVDPQIIKMYSSDNISEMTQLSLLSARYTFYLALILILPLYLDIDTILNIWLEEVPPSTVEFTKLILIFSLIQTFDMSFGSIFKALGKIKENQILGGITYLFVLPLGYIGFSMYGLEPIDIVYIQIIAVLIVSFVVKVYLLNKLTNISYQEYLNSFLIPVIKVTIGVILLSYGTIMFTTNSISIIVLSVLSVLISVYYLDMNAFMRSKIISYIIKTT
jgi:O-antigen/teichoic acid export membrane protein